MPKEHRKGRMRISLDVPKKIHEGLRTIAFFQNKTMTSIAIEALINYMNEASTYCDFDATVFNKHINNSD